MANSTTIITDLQSAITNGASATTLANAIAPTSQGPIAGGAGGFTNGTGIYASGSYFGGILDYPGALKLLLLKAQEMAVLLQKVLATTDQATDATNQTLLVKILNDLQ